jgi:hypothetical protein
MNRHERRANRAKGIDIGDLEVKHGGRTLDFKVLVNTDEPIEEVLMRIREAAQGPNLKMVMVAGGELEPADAIKVWEALLPVMEEQAKKGGVA